MRGNGQVAGSSEKERQRSRSPANNRARFRERVALRLLERPSSPVKLPEVVTASTSHQQISSQPLSAVGGGVGRRSLSADLFDILKNHAKGIVSRPTTSMAAATSTGGLFSRPQTRDTTYSLRGGIVAPSLTQAPQDTSRDALRSAMSLLKDHSQPEKDFSLLCICTEDCPVFFEALSRASNCRVLNFQGAAFPTVAEKMLIRAVQANPTPIAEVIINGSTFAACKGLSQNLVDICAANVAKKILDDDNAARRAQILRQQSAMAVFVTQRGMLEDKLKLVRQAVVDEQTREIRQIRRAWRVAKVVAEVEQVQREASLAFSRGVQALRLHEASARAAIMRQSSEEYADFFLQCHAASLSRIAIIEQKERRTIWRRYCSGWLASTQLRDRRLLVDVVAQRKLGTELYAQREHVCREELEQRQVFLQQRFAEFTLVKRGESEVKQRKDDERRRTRQKQTEEDQHLEHLRSKAKADSYRAAQSDNTRGSGKGGGKGAGPSWAVESEASLRVVLEDVENIAFKLLNAARRAVERAVGREERLYETGRRYQALLRQPGKVEFRIHRSAPYTSIFVGNRKCVPIETGLRVYMVMDPLWVVRASVLRDEVEKHYTGCKTARKESLQSISAVLQEVESKLRIEKIDMQWPRAVRQFLSTGKKQLQEFADGLLAFTVAEALARKETIFSGVLDISLKEEYRELGDLVVVEKVQRSEHARQRGRKKKKVANPLSIEGEDGDDDDRSRQNAGGDEGGEGGEASDDSSTSDFSDDDDDENPEAALMARIQKNFLRRGPRRPPTWSRVTDDDTTDSVRVQVATTSPASSIASSFNSSAETGSSSDAAQDAESGDVDPEAIFISPGDIVRSRSKGIRFSIPTQATALDIEEAIRSVRFVLRPYAEEHFKLSQETFEIGVIDVHIKVFAISHRMLMRKPVRWPRLVQQAVTTHHHNRLRSPAPEMSTPQQQQHPGEDAVGNSFERTNSGTSFTTVGAVARWKSEAKSFPRLIKIESDVSLNFLIGRKILNLDQELVIQHDAREYPVRILQDQYALVIWEPPYLIRGVSRFTLERHDDPDNNTSDGSLLLMGSSFFASTTGVDSQPDLAQLRDRARGNSMAGSSEGGGNVGSSFSLPPSVFRRATMRFEMTQRANASSEDVLFLQNTDHLEALDGRITYVSNYEAFATSLMEDSDLPIGGTRQSRSSIGADGVINLDEPKSRHQATNVQIASFTSQATDIFIQFVFPWSMDMSIIREAMEMIAYKNTSVAPMIGPRHVKVTVQSDYGVEESALIVINVTARDDPTSWNIVGTTGVSVTLPIDARHVSNVLGENFSTEFKPLHGTTSSLYASSSSQAAQSSSSSSSLWNYVKPPMIKFASSVDVIDDDTTFFSGGYLRIKLHEEKPRRSSTAAAAAAAPPPLDEADFGSAVSEPAMEGSLFFDPEENHESKFLAFADAPLSRADGIGVFLDIPQQKAPFGLSMSPCIADSGGSGETSLVYLLYDDAWQVGTVRLCHPRGSIRRPVVSGINVVGGPHCPASPKSSSAPSLNVSSAKVQSSSSSNSPKESAATPPAEPKAIINAESDEVEEQVLFACDILVEFDESVTGATIDTIQELLRVVTFTSTLVRGDEAMKRRVSTIEMLVGATTARHDILGNELPDTKVNQPLRCAFFLEPRSCFFASHEDTSLTYKENSGPAFLFDSGLSIARSFVGGYMRLDILDDAREDEDSVFVADRQSLLHAASTLSPLVDASGATSGTPRKLSMDVSSEASESSAADLGPSNSVVTARTPLFLTPVKSFSADECCRVEPVVPKAGTSGGVASAFELSSFAKVNMMTVQDVIEATNNDPSSFDKLRKSLGVNPNNNPIPHARSNSNSDTNSQSLSGGTAALISMQAVTGFRHSAIAVPPAPGVAGDGNAASSQLPSPLAVSKTLPRNSEVPSAINKDDDFTQPVPLGRKHSLMHNPRVLLESNVEAISQQAVLGEREREIIERSTDHPSFQVTLASATSARRSSFRALARQRSLCGNLRTSISRSSPKALIDHRIAEHAAQELVWANRMKRIMMARNSKFTYLLAKSCYKLVQDRKDHLAAIGLDVQLVQPEGLAEFKILTRDGTEVGTAIVKNHGLVRSVVIVFQPEVVVTPETFNAVCRTIAFKSTSRNPHFLRKYVRVTLHVDDEGDSNILVPIDIQPFDDPTEISLAAKCSTLSWKPSGTELTAAPRQFSKGMQKAGVGKAAQGGGGPSSLSLNIPVHNPATRHSSISPRSTTAASPAGVSKPPAASSVRKEGLGVLQLFPPGTTVIDDPDTTHWDGGFVEISICRGFTEGLDALMVLTLEQQVLLLGPAAILAAGHSTHQLLLVDVQPPFVTPPTKVIDFSQAAAVEAQNKVIQENMQPLTRTLRILHALDRSLVLDNIGTVSISTTRGSSDDASEQHVEPTATLAVRFHASVSVFDRQIGLNIVQLVSHSLGFFTLDSPTSPSLVKSKVLSIKIADEDNIKNPGYRRIGIDCAPTMMFKPVELQKPILYTLKSAQESKPELLFLGLQSKCYVTDKDKFPFASIEVFPVAGFSAGDKLMIKPSGQNITITQDGIVLLGKDMVARNLSVTPISIKFDVNKDCRGATWPRVLQLLSVIGYCYDLKEATKNSGVGGRDMSSEALFPSADRIVCLQVSELKAVAAAPNSVTSPVGHNSIQEPFTPVSSPLAEPSSASSIAKRAEPFFFLQRISTTEGIVTDV